MEQLRAFAEQEQSVYICARRWVSCCRSALIKLAEEIVRAQPHGRNRCLRTATHGKTERGGNHATKWRRIQRDGCQTVSGLVPVGVAVIWGFVLMTAPIRQINARSARWARSNLADPIEIDGPGPGSSWVSSWIGCCEQLRQVEDPLPATGSRPKTPRWQRHCAKVPTCARGPGELSAPQPGR